MRHGAWIAGRGRPRTSSPAHVSAATAGSGDQGATPSHGDATPPIVATTRAPMAIFSSVLGAGGVGRSVVKWPRSARLSTMASAPAQSDVGDDGRYEEVRDERGRGEPEPFHDDDVRRVALRDCQGARVGDGDRREQERSREPTVPVREREDERHHEHDGAVQGHCHREQRARHARCCVDGGPATSGGAGDRRSDTRRQACSVGELGEPDRRGEEREQRRDLHDGLDDWLRVERAVVSSTITASSARTVAVVVLRTSMKTHATGSSMLKEQHT